MFTVSKNLDQNQNANNSNYSIDRCIIKNHIY